MRKHWNSENASYDRHQKASDGGGCENNVKDCFYALCVQEINSEKHKKSIIKLGNLPYGVTEDSIKEFFRGLNISVVHLPCEPSNPETLKGFGYAEFEDLDSLHSALSFNKESLGNRIRVDVADQAPDKDRDDHSFGRDRNRDSDKTNTDWRARPAADCFDDYPPRSGDDSFGDKYRDCYHSDGYRDGYRDSYRDGPHRDMDRYGGRDRYDD
ncbi:hypothetical protein JEQ12_017156 [Ovis aries]|uniref:RRM domain-containing protein n=1 Tax=Ovis aries TaxID=9940 RepID=A0A836D1U5_SHEEP|nr:hypothetical protein JEQ12_017156 [Ovis aries]